MASPFPSDPRKIRQRIRSYERKLRQDEDEDGDIDDGYGKRFLLGPLYMLLGDLDGTLDYFEWYERKFPDDCLEPRQGLVWALALHHAGRDDAAFHKLYRTMLANLYLVPHLLGEHPGKLDIQHHSNFEWLEYAVRFPEELLALWSEEDRAWARSVYDDPRVREKRDRCIWIRRQLKSELPGPRRTQLIREERELEQFRFSPGCALDGL